MYGFGNKQNNMKTIGEKRIKINFNTSGSDIVDYFKFNSAALIDCIQAIKNDKAVLPENSNLDPKEYNEKYSGLFRLIDEAQTKYEEACMLAVKAATWK